MIKDDIQSVLWTVYQRKGYKALVDCSWELMSHCEHNAYDMTYRQMKGEIAEVVLDCGLRELQSVIRPSIVLKGLCIPIRSTGSTTELDLIFVTKRKIYLLECKSYKNKPKVTDECLLGGSTDVAGQSKFHLKGLHEYIGKLCNKEKGTPYKFILFEMSTEGVDDQRTEENKKRIPIANPNNFKDIILEDYENDKDIWDFDSVVKVLKPLASGSDEMFKKHLNRMIHKNKGGA